MTGQLGTLESTHTLADPGQAETAICESLLMETLVARPSPPSMLDHRSLRLSSSSAVRGDRARKRFSKMVELFGVSRVDGDEMELLAMANLKSAIGRLHDNNNPLNLLNLDLLNSNSKEEKERLYASLDKIDSKLQSPGFMTFQEYSQLLGDSEASSVDSTIRSYLQQLESGTVLFKWPPPLFTLGLTLLQIVVFLLSLLFVHLTQALHFNT